MKRLPSVSGVYLWDAESSRRRGAPSALSRKFHSAGEWVNVAFAGRDRQPSISRPASRESTGDAAAIEGPQVYARLSYMKQTITESLG